MAWAPSLLSRIQPRERLLLGVFVAALVIAAICDATGALTGFERQTVDARFALRGSRPAPKRIVIVAVDQRTLDALNFQLPIPRSYYGKLLDRVRAANPRLVGIDVQFIGVSQRRDQDRALLASLARNGPVLFATPDTGGSPTVAGYAAPPGAIPASAGVQRDPDGVLRRMLYVQVRLKTFAVRAAELLNRKPVSANQFHANRAWIDFRGRPGTFRTYSLIDVLRGHVALGRFTNEVVLVGVTAPAAKDVFLTSGSSIPLSGVEMQANALATVLDGFPLKPISAAANVLIFLLLAAVPLVLSRRVPSLYVVLISLAVGLVFLVAAQLAFNGGGIVALPVPLLGLVLTTGGSVAADALIERRQRQALEVLVDRYGLLRPANATFFISYRRNDSEFAAYSLRKELANRFGDSSVFMDTRAIRAGEKWPQRIQEALLGASVMLVLIGNQWLEASDEEGNRRLENPEDWVRREVETGLHRPELVIVPVLLSGVAPPAQHKLPTSLTPLMENQAVALTGDDLGAEVQAILDAIEHARVRTARIADDA